MQVGVVFPQYEIADDRDTVRAYAVEVERLGFGGLHVYEHVLGGELAVYPHLEGRYTAETVFHEPFVLFGYLAAATPGLELASGVVILPQRQAVLVAKQAAEADLLTGGRFRLGVGLGWNELEYVGLGMEWRNRARRFEEQIELMRRLWVEPSLTFEGRYHTVVSAGIRPLPLQRPIPVWIGGFVEPALKRAARIADGVMMGAPMAGMSWTETVATLRGWVEAEGRDPAAFGVDARVGGARGTKDDWVREIEELQGLGVSHLTLGTLGAGRSGLDEHLGLLGELAGLALA